MTKRDEFDNGFDITCSIH